MQKSSVILLALVLCQFASAFQVVEKITNGGFERLDERQFPVDWNFHVSQVDDAVVRVTTDAAEGRYAVYMESRSTAIAYVSRSYRRGMPGEFVPDIGAMLPFKKGALVFRYKVIKVTSDNVRVYAIPMKADNWEGGASREAYIVPAEFSGDNKWHTGVLAFDFSDKPEVRSVQIGLRINEGGKIAPAAVIFDDFRFVEKAGWHLKLVSFVFMEGENPNEQCHIILLLQNTGDEPAPINAQLSAPKNLAIKAIEIPSSVEPKKVASLRWVVKGKIEVDTKFVVQWESMPKTIETLERTYSGRIWRPVWDFNRDNDSEAWGPYSHLSPFEVKGGILKTHSTGEDPHMYGPLISAIATRFKTLVLRLRIQFPQGTQPIGQVFWIRADDPNWSESKSLRFPLPTDGQWHELKVDLSKSPEWKGIIIQLRFDPGSGSGIVLELDYVKLE